LRLKPFAKRGIAHQRCDVGHPKLLITLARAGVGVSVWLGAAILVGEDSDSETAAAIAKFAMRGITLIALLQELVDAVALMPNEEA
jgi:hypothetical protein